MTSRSSADRLSSVEEAAISCIVAASSDAEDVIRSHAAPTSSQCWRRTIDCFAAALERVLLLGEERIECAPLRGVRKEGPQPPVQVASIAG